MRSGNRDYYNPDRHVTAGQLRRLGFYVAEPVENDAFVPRAAVGLDDDEQLHDGSATLGLDLLEPFMPAGRASESLCLAS